MKTAVSLLDELFDEAERLGLSRSVRWVDRPVPGHPLGKLSKARMGLVDKGLALVLSLPRAAAARVRHVAAE
jgi:hypothetical protein